MLVVTARLIGIYTRFNSECVRWSLSATAAILLNAVHKASCKAALRRLWGRTLSPQLLDGYSPLIIDEALTLALASNAVGSCGADWAAEQVAQGAVMLAVLEATQDVHTNACAAAQDVLAARPNLPAQAEVLRACMRSSAAAHLLLPQGYSMDEDTEAFANACEASLVGTSVDSVHCSHFVRAGKVGGCLDASTAVDQIGNHQDFKEQAEGEWASHLELIAGTDSSTGVRALAMGYIAGNKARARKQHTADGGSRTMHNDGENQPRLRRTYPPTRGIEVLCAGGRTLLRLDSDPPLI